MSEHEADEVDKPITSIPQANRLPVGTVIETIGGHRGIVTSRGTGKHVFWASGPGHDWTARVVLAAAESER